jgi:DnaJ-class molecular chaperone
MGIGRVKIYCHSCEGTGKVTEKAYPSRDEIMVLCPECGGDKWVYANVKTVEKEA